LSTGRHGECVQRDLLDSFLLPIGAYGLHQLHHPLGVELCNLSR
jgi:hypothetical protein